jgi:hypothetical protein
VIGKRIERNNIAGDHLKVIAFTGEIQATSNVGVTIIKLVAWLLSELPTKCSCGTTLELVDD